MPCQWDIAQKELLPLFKKGRVLIPVAGFLSSYKIQWPERPHTIIGEMSKTETGLFSSEVK